jgi:hypothetical protein
VPLSEDEERILQQIEREFYETDPGLAHQVGATTLYRHAWRNIKWASVGFIGGLVLLVITLSVHVVLAFAGFLVMLGSALVIERNARKMGKAGLESVSGSMRAGAGLRDYLGNTGDRMRSRIRRPEEDDE